MIENNNSLLETKSRLSYIFEILRGDINASEYHFVMFLLVLQKEGILNGLLEGKKHNLVESIRNKIFDSNSKNRRIYLNIWDLFEPILARLNNSTLIDIISLLQGLDQLIIQKNFAEIFDDLLYKHAKYQGRIGGEYVLPTEISQFLSNLVELPNDAKIYNPFAGLASFGVYGSENHQYLGQELNHNTWALGQLRLIAYNRENNCELSQGDSIEHWNPRKIFSEKLEDFFNFPAEDKTIDLGIANPPFNLKNLEDFFNFPAEDEKFDLIIANPPFNLRPTHPIDGRFGNIRNCEQFVIEKGLEDLAPNGKLIIIVSTGFLFRGGSEQELRRYLIENDLLDMVISFPGGLLFNTGIPISVIVINKYGKKDRNFVKFIDAKSTIESTKSKEKKINLIALEKLVKEVNVSEYVRIIPNEAIAQLDYNLNMPRYFQKEIEGVELKELINPLNLNKNFYDNIGQLIYSRDLKDDNLNYHLELDDIDEDDFSMIRGVQKVSESCLLFAKRSKTLKPTLFQFEGKPIFITSDILAFKVNESKVNIAYLINELYSTYVNEQLDSFRISSTIPSMNRENLLSIKILLPNLDEQRGKVAGLIELSETIKALKAQNNTLDLGLKAKNYEEFASLKHTLGTPRQNILSYTNVLLAFFEKNQSSAFTEVNDNFTNELGIDLFSILKSIKHDIGFISELLEKGEKGLVLTDYTLETIPLTEVQNIIYQYRKVGNNFNIVLLPIDNEDKKKLGIDINRALLRVILDNIISNVEKHGFNKKLPDNKLIIDLKIIDNEFIIDIKNNGKPFPRNFDKDKFTAKFSTANANTGMGLGGYDINRIISYFNAKWALILNEEIFPVRFVFQFPITSLK